MMSSGRRPQPSQMQFIQIYFSIHTQYLNQWCSNFTQCISFAFPHSTSNLFFGVSHYFLELSRSASGSSLFQAVSMILPDYCSSLQIGLFASDPEVFWSILHTTASVTFQSIIPLSCWKRFSMAPLALQLKCKPLSMECHGLSCA